MHLLQGGLIALLVKFVSVLAQEEKPFIGNYPGPFYEFSGVSDVSATSPLNVLFVDRGDYSFLERRQRTCGSDQGYCAGNNGVGACCPLDNRCCITSSSCLPPGYTCCTSGTCSPGETCCGNDCIPTNGECCRDGKWCSAGNICVIDSITGVSGCCTDLRCTSKEGDSQSPATTTRPTPTPPPSVTQPPITTPPPAPTSVVVPHYFYFTITWYYYYYYYIYVAYIDTTTLTSTRITTYYTTSYYGTDVAEASASFNLDSATLILPSASTAPGTIPLSTIGIPTTSSTKSSNISTSTQAARTAVFTGTAITSNASQSDYIRRSTSLRLLLLVALVIITPLLFAINL